jgi:hypothetical protein
LFCCSIEWRNKLNSVDIAALICLLFFNLPFWCRIHLIKFLILPIDKRVLNAFFSSRSLLLPFFLCSPFPCVDEIRYFFQFLPDCWAIQALLFEIVKRLSKNSFSPKKFRSKIVIFCVNIFCEIQFRRIPNSEPKKTRNSFCFVSTISYVLVFAASILKSKDDSPFLLSLLCVIKLGFNFHVVVFEMRKKFLPLTKIKFISR